MKKIVILVSVLMLLMVNVVNAKSNKAKKRIGDKKFEKISSNRNDKRKYFCILIS